MPTPRFFVDFDLTVGHEVALPDDVAHHATRALRLDTGALIVLFNGRGGEFRAVLRIDDRHAFATVQSFDPVERESPLDLTLIQAWISTDKLDWVVEKAVELGVSRIVLTPSARSVVRVEVMDRQRRPTSDGRARVARCRWMWRIWSSGWLTRPSRSTSAARS